MTEQQRIALGFRPRTLTGWWFWLRYWSPPAVALAKIHEGRSIRARYQELLYAVASKYPGESRHETALRYIRSCESRSSLAAEAKRSEPGDQRVLSAGRQADQDR